jgi:hypothetical protein
MKSRCCGLARDRRRLLVAEGAHAPAELAGGPICYLHGLHAKMRKNECDVDAAQPRFLVSCGDVTRWHHFAIVPSESERLAQRGRPDFGIECVGV